MPSNLHTPKELGETLASVLCKYRDICVSTTTPREVYVVDLRNGKSPRDARRAIEALAELHVNARFPEFCKLLKTVYPFREDTFGFDMWSDVMPMFALQIDSHLPETLDRAEQFRFPEVPSNESGLAPIDLLVEIKIDRNVMIEFLARLAQFVEYLTIERLGIRVAMVKLELGVLPLRDEERLREIRLLCDSMLCRTSELAGCEVSLEIPWGGTDEDVSPQHSAALGGLFQAIGRVGCSRFPTLVAASDYTGISDQDCNTLKVEIERNAPPRIVVALWSAVAFSTGYNRLEINTQMYDSTNIPRDCAAELLIAKYLTTVLVLQQSDIGRLHWTRQPLLQPEVEAMETMRAATDSYDGVWRALWDQDWSKSHSSCVFELAALNKTIASRFGWAMLDPGHGGWIDVFVPGFGQCSVKRDQWDELLHCNEISASKFSLTHLDVRGPSTKEDAQLFGSMLAVLGSTLTHLTLTNSTTAGLLAVFESCPRLRHLKIESFQAPHDISVDLKNLVVTALETLQIEIAQEEAPVDQFDEFFAFVLPVVGTRLRSVRIETKIDGIFSDGRRHPSPPILSFVRSFQVLVRSSPDLKSVVLQRLAVDQLDPLIDAYQRGTTKVSSLRLLGCPLESASIVRFAEALRSPMFIDKARLQSLAIKHIPAFYEDRERLRGLDVVSIPALLEAVRVNFTIRLLLLQAQRLPDLSQPYNELENAFRVFRSTDRANNESRCRALATEALASVLQARRWSWNEEVLKQVMSFLTFDRRVIELSLVEDRR